MEELVELTLDEIIAGCRKGKLKAQKDLYDLHCDEMFTLAFRLTGNFDDANDVLQDAFISVFKDIKQYRGEASIAKWIKTIVFRTALKKIKDEKRFTDFEDHYLTNTTIQKNMYDGEIIEKLILSLPDGYRAVFCMIAIEGYTHKEVAGILKINEGTTKSQLHHAKKLLRAKMRLYFDADE